MYKRIPKVENISEYAKHKVLAHLTKPRCVSIKFVTNDPDGWTIDKLCFKNKTGEITLNEGIIEKEYEYWVQSYIEKGYKKL